MSDFTNDIEGEDGRGNLADSGSTESTTARAGADPVPAGSAILRAMRVLEAIAACHAPPQLAEICKAVDLPKPTVFRILSTLEHAGLVGREPGSKRYHCGPRMNQLAGEVLMTSPARSARRAILEELVEQVGETCNLTIANGNTVLCLDRVETSWPLKITITAGTTVPIHSSASGKLFMAHMPRRSRERLVRQLPLVRNTPHTLTDPSRLFEEFEKIRQQGYSTEREEYLSGIFAMAVPVHDADGRVAAAVSIHAPVSRLPMDEAVQLLPELQSAAEAMGQTLDW
ncbi:IclR family transcriptional regulator [Burkholderiaceae bacterium FT117]|uniref:IclR family transcriptional regulator n=1 Tax=Zeimonas sediminis TaxID=2944268 RepID=UPI0023430A0A|nr:IclR family transcriptional regulator [Zeimonas sediminis]MCM5569995.1 IclR family transcriptional regulator [Zeimonas sediminis]